MDQEIKPQTPSADQTPAENTPAAAPVTPPAAEAPKTFAAKSEKKGLPTAAIVGVIIALILAVIGFLAWKKSETKPAAVTTPVKTTAAAATVTKVSAAEITTTSADIDKTLSALDDTKDFPAADVSDSSLGLQ